MHLVPFKQLARNKYALILRLDTTCFYVSVAKGVLALSALLAEGRTSTADLELRACADGVRSGNLKRRGAMGEGSPTVTLI